MHTSTLFREHAHRPATRLLVEGADDAAEASIQLGAGRDVLCEDISDVSDFHAGWREE